MRSVVEKGNNYPEWGWSGA